MPKLRHPFSGALYDLAEDGAVVVEADGRSGRFDRDGNWLSGDLRSADPQMCRWMADPRLPRRHRALSAPGGSERR